MLSHSEIVDIADEVLRATLGAHGFERSEVVDDIDSDGLRAVQVTARFKPGSQPAEGRAALAALTGLRATLRARGDERFPFLRYDYPDDELPGAEPEDFDP